MPPSVLITGETGTGKDLAARAIHYSGARQDGPFIHVNCAGIEPSALEAELMGDERRVPGSESPAAPGLIEAADGGRLTLPPKISRSRITDRYVRFKLPFIVVLPSTITTVSSEG